MDTETIVINRPIVIFAKSFGERDYLRGVLSPKNKKIFIFENESICFDNLSSIDPQLILLRSDSIEVILRFISALNALKIDSELLIISSVMNAQRLNMNCRNVIVHSLPNVYESRFLSDVIDEMLNKKMPEQRTKFIGVSPIMKGLSPKLPKLMHTSDPLLIEGERGTGKELLARMITRSTNSHALFIKVDCKALTADKGMNILDYSRFLRNFAKSTQSDAVKEPITILLSKIDWLDLRTQSEILLLLEKDPKIWKWSNNYHAEVRFIATSETDLSHMVRQERFRKDLYYRLNVIPIHMPALRERRDDIPLLMDHFAIEACVELKRSFLFPTPFLYEQLSTYRWPGNMDELRSAMNQWAVSGNETQLLLQMGINNVKHPQQFIHKAMDANAFPDPMEIQNCLNAMDRPSLKSICDKMTYKTEKKILQKTLEITNWNRKKAATLLNISYKSMLNKMKMYEII